MNFEALMGQKDCEWIGNPLSGIEVVSWFLGRPAASRPGFILGFLQASHLSDVGRDGLLVKELLRALNPNTDKSIPNTMRIAIKQE